MSVGFGAFFCSNCKRTGMAAKIVLEYRWLYPFVTSQFLDDPRLAGFVSFTAEHRERKRSLSIGFFFLFFSEIGSGAAPQGPPPEGVRESLTLCTCPASAGVSFLASRVSCVCGLADTSRGCDGAGPYPH